MGTKIARFKELGSTSGVGNNKFAPNKQITRQEMFTLLYSALDKLGELPAAANSKTLASFSDAPSVADYTKDVMTALVKGGVISGNNGKLNPLSPSTRAQMVQILYILL